MFIDNTRRVHFTIYIILLFRYRIIGVIGAITIISHIAHKRYVILHVYYMISHAYYMYITYVLHVYYMCIIFISCV